MSIEKLKHLAIQIFGEDSHDYELLIKHIQAMDRLLAKFKVTNVIDKGGTQKFI